MQCNVHMTGGGAKALRKEVGFLACGTIDLFFDRTF